MADAGCALPARRLCLDEILLSAVARHCRGAQSDETVFPYYHRTGNPAAVRGVWADQPMELQGDASSAAGRARQCGCFRLGDRGHLSDDRQVIPMPPELCPAEGNRQWRLITDTVMGGVSRG